MVFPLREFKYLDIINKIILVSFKLSNLMTSRKYFLLAAVFGFLYLLVTYTEIYGSPTWFRVFVAILAFTYAIIGLSNLDNEKNKD